MTAPDELVVRKWITIACDREHAFRVFTEDIASWWPLATHSVFEERAATCGIEGRIGGRIFERAADGDKSVWGTITAWDPPKHMAFTWHPGTTSGWPAMSRCALRLWAIRRVSS